MSCQMCENVCPPPPLFYSLIQWNERMPAIPMTGHSARVGLRPSAASVRGCGFCGCVHISGSVKQAYLPAQLFLHSLSFLSPGLLCRGWSLSLQHTHTHRGCRETDLSSGSPSLLGGGHEIAGESWDGLRSAPSELQWWSPAWRGALS